MLYRVTASMAFTSEDEARDFFHDCEIAMPKSQTINPGQDNEEKGIAILEACYHDETPVKPCNRLNYIETP